MPRRKYSAEMREFIAANIKGQRYSALAELVSETFGIEISKQQMRAYAKNHGLRNELPTRCPGEPSRLFPQPVREFIERNFTGTLTSDLTEMINERFGTSYSASQIRTYKQNHKLSSGLDTRIKPGNIPPNKGKKGYCPPGCEKGWFKSGHIPKNHLEIGAEVMTTDGYLAVKIAEPNVWKPKHILVWEETKGSVPDGKAVVFLDQDHTNTKLENLAIVSRSELLELNRRDLITSDAELTAMGVLVARVNCQISKIKHAKKEANQ